MLEMVLLYDIIEIIVLTYIQCKKYDYKSIL